MSEQTDEQIEAHNRREMWRDIANHLKVAYEAIGQAQAGLEDVGRAAWADQLQPLADVLRTAANEAEAER